MLRPEWDLAHGTANGYHAGGGPHFLNRDCSRSANNPLLARESPQPPLQYPMEVWSPLLLTVPSRLPSYAMSMVYYCEGSVRRCSVGLPGFARKCCVGVPAAALLRSLP